jgi:peptidoglycan/xylan/chitin deacetylase (PgdA/CDA1 family)
MSLRSKLRIRKRVRSAIHWVRPPKPRPLILNYHRIADPTPADFWGLAVSPAKFREQLQVLRRHHYVLPLAQFISKLFDGALPSNAVALTFDDGYVDNLVAAKPLLAAADTPATAFIVTNYIGRSEPYWWDELATFILLKSKPQKFEIVVGNQCMQFDFCTEDGTTSVDTSKARHAALWKIWGVLRLLDEEDRQSEMKKLRSIFPTNDHQTIFGRAMTGDEVRKIASNGLVAIGAHTATHAVVKGMESSACRREITESKLACEALIGAPVTAFAYPYGDFDAEAREAVRAAGFAFACATQRRPVNVTPDVFALPRVHIPNIGGDAFEKALRLASAVG